MDSIAKQEEKILEYWEKNKIFAKSVTQNKKNKTFSFYDGPPFATGSPHYGTLLPSFIKDTVLRYQNMQGLYTKRQWGWDCHGLPIENLTEKQLQLKCKKEIEKIGIKIFNQTCRDNVLTCKDEWKNFITRIGRWVDMDKSYKTMETDYMESIWWAFKQLWLKGLIYQGYKAMHICPRCETTLANFEVALGYKETQDISIIVKFKISEQKNTFFLAWTTTAWTLPGNVALAINPTFTYTKITLKNNQFQSAEYFILAKDRLEMIKQEYEIIEEFQGEVLIGLSYEPLFNYYSNDKGLKNRQNGWKVYPADFVAGNEGTGVVHIAPAFGEEDMLLGQKYNLPFIQHIEENGSFKQEIKLWAGEQVKPQENYAKTDEKIIAHLDKKNQLVSHEKVTHRYPFCWRCKTPLLNYATSSWFVNVTKIKESLIKNNHHINWVPEHIKFGRFGKGLEEAPDWAISRSRFWGTPLPVWQCQQCDNITIIGSKKELIQQKFTTNQYFILRHGEALTNTKKIISCWPEISSYPLTLTGKKQITAIATKLKNKKIELIFSSDLLRTKETAEIIEKELKIKAIFDERLREVNFGCFNGKPEKETLKFWHKEKTSTLEYILKRHQFSYPQGESYLEIEKRLLDFIKEIEQKYQHKNILLISHQHPLTLLEKIMSNYSFKKLAKITDNDKEIKIGELRKIKFKHLPYNEKMEIDLHRPYIDEIKFFCPNCRQVMKRIPEVFDCWFESGSMPFAHLHYPFHNKKIFAASFPADFITEGLDQTRGWFYSLLVLSTALFNQPAFKNVVVNGLILTEDGQKMSKSLKNYPDPIEIINQYGCDALRYYFLSSALVNAESSKFSLAEVDQIFKKNILILLNVNQFQATYSSRRFQMSSQLEKNFSHNLLDRWIISKLYSLTQEITEAMEKYKLMSATQPIQIFITDLSTWYLRRSRKRFKQEQLDGGQNNVVKNEILMQAVDKENAEKTLFFVLKNFSIIIAPFMPFLAEYIYLNLKRQYKQGFKQSVHLERWPKLNNNLINKDLEKKMADIRKLISQGLAQRKEANIKVRQPLQSLIMRDSNLRNEKQLLDLIKDEINVKQIFFDPNINEEIKINLHINSELEKEGQMREIIRAIQVVRKKQGLTPNDQILINIGIENEEFKKEIEQKQDYIKKNTLADKIIFTSNLSGEEKSIKIKEKTIFLQVEKIKK